MLGISQSRAGPGGSDSSPLASQLQQAWLHSQIPKVQKRGLSTQVRDVSMEKRASYLQSYQSSPELLSILFDHASGPNVIEPEGSFFHKTRSDTPDFPKRPALPELVSYSRKTELPQRSRSGPLSDGVGSPEISSGSSQRPSSLTHSASFPPTGTRRYAVDDILNSIEREHIGAAEIAGQTEPLIRFLDGILMDKNMEEEKCMDQEGSAYQAMVNEITDLIAPDSSGFDDSEPQTSDYDTSWTKTIFVPTEEGVTDKLVHAYTSNLSKHITDVSPTSGNVDSNSWINESDACTDHLDSSWDAYVDQLGYKPNVSSSFLQHLPLDRGRFSISADHMAIAPPPCVKMTDLLLRCALVVSQDDVRSANDLIGELRQHSTAYGNATQRMAYYYMEALVAKMSGTGAQLYTAISNNSPSAATMLKAHRLFVDYSPFIKLSHFFGMKAILDAFEGATRVHVVDYGALYGAQWPCLIQHLSQRPEGPPHLRITCIDFPQPGNKPSARVQDTCRRLADFAKLWGVPFEHHALADKWEAITPAQLSLRHDEVLAVNCLYRLRNLLDESCMAASPRKIVLNRIRSMNPKVFVMGVIHAGYNAPFFMTRFRESIKHYSTMFDAMEVSMPSDDPDRVILEREIYGRQILNIVACEGLERVERAEPYRQWQSRTLRAGFSLKPLKPIVALKMKTMMASYHKDYGVGEDGGWFLIGWKNQITHALSVWEPTPGSYS